MFFTVSDKFKGVCVKCLWTIDGVAYHHDGPFPLKNGPYDEYCAMAEAHIQINDCELIWDGHTYWSKQWPKPEMRN
jgi:hypothetical protein